MCHLIPMGQTFGLTMSSLSLLTIAADRYRSINGATRINWNPNLWSCILYKILLWIIAAGVFPKIMTQNVIKLFSEGNF